jgi:hypothetical protein
MRPWKRKQVFRSHRAVSQTSRGGLLECIPSIPNRVKLFVAGTHVSVSLLHARILGSQLNYVYETQLYYSWLSFRNHFIYWKQLK